MAAYGAAAIEALADPTRRAVFELVGEEPRSVSDLAHRLPVSRPAVSQHLKVLKDARLVSARTVGTRHIYALDPTGLAAVRDYFTRFWAVALAAYADVVDQTVDPRPTHPDTEE